MPIHDFIAGIAGGLAVVVVGHPFDTASFASFINQNICLTIFLSV